MAELERENESLKQNIGGAPVACTHEEDIICLKRELEEANMKENVLTNQLEEWKEICYKLVEEVVALRTNLSKAESKACLNQKFIKGSETLQDIFNMQRSPENKTGLGFKPPLQMSKTNQVPVMQMS